MLLSFPLDASADVLEIISDSVYANSSTLDGRRFANDFATRRKNDVAVRYPQIFNKAGLASRPGVKSSGSMASVLAAAGTQPKTSEWNVKVTGKKKKGGK
jgi:PERQ amino acid-rich with GYF domain-containing protein